MFLMQILKSLDELLYEVMSWLIFYPRTLWRAIAHPRSMMRYADAELAKVPDERYLELLSPPLFLLISVLISNIVELALLGDDPLVENNHGLAGLISNDTNLVTFRMVTFAIFPVLNALRIVRCKRERLDRDSLKMPFYGQCFATAPMALLFGVATTLARSTPKWGWTSALALIAVGAAWYLAVETAWYRDQLSCGWIQAFGNALLVYLEAMALLVIALSFMG